MAQCLTRELGAAGLSLTGVTVLCPYARHINPSLVLVQPRETRPYITERLLMGRKESNKQNNNMYLFMFQCFDIPETLFVHCSYVAILF